MPSWSPSGATSPPEASSGSPLARRMADLSAILCPCCGSGWGQSDGYQPMAEASPVVYDPYRPYTTEKPPSVQMASPESYKSESLVSQRRHSLYSDYPSMQPAATSVLGSNANAPLPAISTMSVKDDAHLQPMPHGLQTLPSQAVKREAMAYPDQRLVMGESLLNSAPPRLTYPPMLLDLTGELKSFRNADDATSQRYAPMTSTIAAHRAYPATREPVAQHENKSNFDILQPNQRGGKRGPFRDPSLREQTAQTRKIGSCIRCRMQRIRCEHNADDPSGQCLTCKRVANTKAGRFPCLRYKITDVRLYKLGQVPGYEWTKRWSSSVSDPIQEWATAETRTIHVSEGFSDQVLELRVRKFIPQEGDKLERSWYHNGDKKTVAIPPFALVDLEDGKESYMKHIQNSMNQAFGTILGRDAGLLYKTYYQTVEHCKDTSTPSESRDLLRHTFKLWMAIRFSTSSCFIVGEETLGMPRDILDQTSPNPGKIPLPPVLGAQLDLILIHHIQSQLRRQVLDKLERMVSKKKLNTWMITYLVTFVLLHNTALITAHDAGYARKHGMKRRFAREDKVKEYHLGANILLAHFHYCNRGIHPFSEECSDHDLRTLAGLDDDQIHFVHQTRSFVRRQKQEWEDVRARGDVEDDYYFVSQLFEENWCPRSAI